MFPGLVFVASWCWHFASATTGQMQCEMVPFEAGNLVGHCCVYVKNKSRSDMVFPRDEVEKQVAEGFDKNKPRTDHKHGEETSSENSALNDGILLFPGEFYKSKKKAEEDGKKNHRVEEELTKNDTSTNNATSAVPTTEKSVETTTITNTNRNGVGVPDNPCPAGYTRDVSGNCSEEL